MQHSTNGEREKNCDSEMKWWESFVCHASHAVIKELFLCFVLRVEGFVNDVRWGQWIVKWERWRFLRIEVNLKFLWLLRLLKALSVNVKSLTVEKTSEMNRFLWFMKWCSKLQKLFYQISTKLSLSLDIISQQTRHLSYSLETFPRFLQQVCHLFFFISLQTPFNATHQHPNEQHKKNKDAGRRQKTKRSFSKERDKKERFVFFFVCFFVFANDAAFTATKTNLISCHQLINWFYQYLMIIIECVMMMMVIRILLKWMNLKS